MRDPKAKAQASVPADDDPVVRVRRIHRRDLNRVWEFLKLVFRDVNRETVEYQRPRSKKRFLEVYEEEGVEQLLFEATMRHKSEIVGYLECAFEITGSDNWMNKSYFTKHDMRPLFVEELAVHTAYQGHGIGGFILEQLEHLARVRGCTHLVLEVAENNINALSFYRARSFYKMDAAVFLAKKVAAEDELLPPRSLSAAKKNDVLSPEASRTRAPRRTSVKPSTKRSQRPLSPKEPAPVVEAAKREDEPQMPAKPGAPNE
jgi:ribosomal protein S18 acetylase RimI-like enzyme